jgi:AraC-like DNA-binding protein/mannose-6-phosphate isomerase-like protein (cupin superfamily)
MSDRKTTHRPPPAGRAVAEVDLGRERFLLTLNTRAPYFIAAHRHRHFELLFILKGRRGLSTGGRRYVARPGDVMVFRPGDVHEECSRSQRISYLTLRFSAEELSRAGIGFPETAGFGPVFRLPERERFEGLFRRMLLEHRKTDADSELLLGAHIAEFVVLLRRALGRAAPGTALGGSVGGGVRAAVELIRENLGRELRREELARASFMSVSHFAHRFREAVGQSPRRFVISERIARAKRLLAETARSAQDISRELGYESPYFFYRQFRQKTGMTSGEFRRRARGGL